MDPRPAGTIMSDYLIEAQFIPYFNNHLLKRQVRAVAVDAIKDMQYGEIIEDMVDQ